MINYTRRFRQSIIGAEKRPQKIDYEPPWFPNPFFFWPPKNLKFSDPRGSPMDRREKVPEIRMRWRRKS